MTKNPLSAGIVTSGAPPSVPHSCPLSSRECPCEQLDKNDIVARLFIARLCCFMHSSQLASSHGAENYGSRFLAVMNALSMYVHFRHVFLNCSKPRLRPYSHLCKLRPCFRKSAKPDSSRWIRVQHIEILYIFRFDLNSGRSNVFAFLRITDPGHITLPWGISL